MLQGSHYHILSNVVRVEYLPIVRNTLVDHHSALQITSSRNKSHHHILTYACGLGRFVACSWMEPLRRACGLDLLLLARA